MYDVLLHVLRVLLALDSPRASIALARGFGVAVCLKSQCVLTAFG